MKKLELRSFMFAFFCLFIIQNMYAEEKNTNILSSSDKPLSGIPVANQQAKTVKGSIKDEAGEPMAGVNIVVEGTTIGTYIRQ